MYTFKFTCGSEIQFGTICHNYATACKQATDFIQQLVESGWSVSSGNMDLIQEPYDIILNNDNKMGRLIVGKLIFEQI
jgi:hypothetical protein